MTVPMLGCLFTTGVLAHTLEEAIWLPAWSTGSGSWRKPVSPAEFRIAALLLSIVFAALTALAFVSDATWVAYAMFGYVLAMVLNAIAPHLLATMVRRRFMPGTATALLLNLPLGALYLRAAYLSGRVSWPTLAWAAPTVVAILLMSLPFWFFLARSILGWRPPALRDRSR